MHFEHSNRLCFFVFLTFSTHTVNDTHTHSSPRNMSPACTHTPNHSPTNTHTKRESLCAETFSDVFLFLHFSFQIRAVVLERLAGI